jgi:aminoglycoside N3'-acetyltransferase
MSGFLERLAEGRRKYGMALYLRREANKHLNKLLFSLDRPALVRALRSLGVREGTTLCVHTSLSRLGYVENGPATVIDALREAVGDQGTVLMPAFSMGGTMLSWVDSGAVFDARTSPVKVGSVPEAFRRGAGVLRSLHPTNSVAGIGPAAAAILADHDRSLTPYGSATPYGRLADRDDAYVLMLDTHVQSLLHHLQERVDFPNLFLDESRRVELIDHEGEKRSMVTKVMRPKLPYFVAVPGASGGEPDWVTLHDFALMFPAHRRKEAVEMGYRPATIRMLEDRRKQFIANGIVRAQRLGRAQIGLLHVASFIRAIQPELEQSISDYRSYYDVALLEGKNLRLA